MNPRGASAGAALGWALLFVVALQATLVVALECRTELRDSEYGIKRARLRAALARAPGRPLVVMLGSSRCLLGFRPAALPPCRTADGREPVVFNAGFLGAGPLMELICLRRLLADGLRPEVVFLECWPPSEIAEGIFRPPVQRLGWRDLRVWGRHTAEPGLLYREWIESRLLPGSTGRAALLQALAPRWLPPREEDYLNVDAAGWKPCPFGYTSKDRERRARFARNDYEAFLQVYRHGETADRELRELLTLCRAEHIRAALVFLPESALFRGWYSPAARAEVDGYLGRLSRDFAVPVIDARAWVADDGFADGYHLLPEGAAAFTARFGREALQPLLEGRPPTQAGRASEGVSRPSLARRACVGLSRRDQREHVP
jgi:hypothetical protein